MVKPNHPGYLSSLGQELLAQSQRIRQLIGSVHWLTDGHHKESLLAGILNRYLPHGFLMGRGFVINPGNPSKSSCELDLVIVDNSSQAPLYHQHDLIVTLPHLVAAVVSVKTTMSSSNVSDTIYNLASAHRLVELNHDNIWYGGFFFESNEVIQKDANVVFDYFDHTLTDEEYKRSFGGSRIFYPLNLTCARNLVFRLNEESIGEGGFSVKIRGFDCGEEASAHFIMDLLAHLAWLRTGDHSSFVTYMEHATEQILSSSPQLLKFD